MNRTAVWSVVGVVAILVVVFFSMFQAGSCRDAAPGHGESICTSGPAIGVPALSVVVVIGAIVVAVSTWQIIRARRR